MKLFAFTGGVGMGKSAAEQFLCSWGVSVVDTDLLAHRIVEPGQPALSEIQHAFGNEFVGPDGQLRRKQLAGVVFSNPKQREKLESILHPRIRQLWKRQIDLWRAEQKPVAVVVIPLLFETGAESEVDVTVCVACSAATQRERLRSRGWTAEQIDQRIAAQWPIQKKMDKAEYVIWTEGGPDVLDEQLKRVVHG
jgi:dephospho-CoA kinase